MSKKLPLTMQGLEVGLDAAMEGDPRAVKEWAERALQAGGWDLVHGLVENLDIWPCPGCNAARGGIHETGCPWWAVAVARDAAAERLDGMPQSLEDALRGGWARIDGSHHSDRACLNVWSGADWRSHLLQTPDIPAADLADYPRVGWERTTDMATPPRTWGSLTAPQQECLLATWAGVVAWKEAGGPRPWERPATTRRLTTQEAFERLGVQVLDARGQLRDADEIIAEVVAALERAEDVERAVIRRGLGIDLNTLEAPGLDRNLIRHAARRLQRQFSPVETEDSGMSRGDLVGFDANGNARRAQPGDRIAGVAVRNPAGGSVTVQTSGVANVTMGLATPNDYHRERGDHRIGEEWVTEQELLGLADRLNAFVDDVRRMLEREPRQLAPLRRWAATAGRQPWRPHETT